MKAPLSLFLLFLLTAGAVAEPPPLLDTDGHEVHAGAKYYMVSISTGAGVTFCPIGKEKCPYSVVHLQFNNLRGIPITFHPVNPAAEVVRESTDLNIRFEARTVCNSSTWQVDNTDNADQATHDYYIKIGGSLGKPGIGTLSNWFKVEAVGEQELHAYKLVFCPAVCDICRVECKDVGIYYAKKKRRLGLVVDAPLTVRFIKRPGNDTQLRHGRYDI